MSPIKQVILLFVILVLFIAGCVYSHLNDFKALENAQVIEEKVVVAQTSEDKPEVVEPVVEKEQEKVVAPVVEEAEKPLNVKKPSDEAIKKIAKQITPKKLDEAKVIKNSNDALQKEVEKETKDNLVVNVTKKDYSHLSQKNQKIQSQMNAITKNQKIIFKRLSTKITEKSYIAVEKIANILLEYPNIKIEIGGHTDAKGKDDVNEWVSLQRAKSVRKELTKYGIAKFRIKAKGYGETRPLVPNDKNGYSAVNRRVEFNIIEE